MTKDERHEYLKRAIAALLDEHGMVEVLCALSEAHDEAEEARHLDYKANDRD